MNTDISSHPTIVMPFQRTWSEDGSYKKNTRQTQKERVLSHRHSSKKYSANNPEFEQQKRQKRKQSMLAAKNAAKHAKATADSSAPQTTSHISHSKPIAGNPGPPLPLQGSVTSDALLPSKSPYVDGDATRMEPNEALTSAVLVEPHPPVLSLLTADPPVPPPSDAEDPVAISIIRLASSLEQLTVGPDLEGDGDTATNRAIIELPSGVTPLSKAQKEALIHGGKLELSRVQRAQMQVVKANVGPLTAPEHTASSPPDNHGVRYLGEKSLAAILAWRSQIEPRVPRVHVPLSRFQRAFNDQVQWRQRDPRLEQLDREAVVVGVEMACKYGRPFHEAWLEIEAAERMRSTGRVHET
ncbi:hypothetical protein C8F01DRAFT_1370737 [Mycena amicta]|nr:hypothetical protein C8F01DRAFT_1370737 [Mycena amicta]